MLPAYLSAIGFDAAEVGLVAAAALLGTAVFTLAVGFVAPRYDLRNLLIAGAALMICTGLAFAQATVIWIVIAVAFFGATINPSTGDIGVLIPLEHAMLTYGVGDERRTHVFARYSLIGALSMAIGALAAATPDLLAATGLERTAAFKLMFYAYAVLGLSCAAIYVCLPHAHAEERPAAAPLSVCAASFTSLRRYSASTPSPEASSCSLCSRCGSSRSSICRLARQVFSFLDDGAQRFFLSAGGMDSEANRAR